MKTEFSDSGMMRIYDDEGNLRLCMQGLGKQQPAADLASAQRETDSSMLSSPYTALAIALLSQS